MTLLVCLVGSKWLSWALGALAALAGFGPTCQTIMRLVETVVAMTRRMRQRRWPLMTGDRGELSADALPAAALEPPPNDPHNCAALTSEA